MACTGSSTASCRSPRPASARRCWFPSSRSGWQTSTPSSTCRSRSTSTVARTRAPGRRSPTSVSRGSLIDDGKGNQIEGFQVHLGGSLGQTRHSAGSCASTRSPARDGRLHRPRRAQLRQAPQRGRTVRRVGRPSRRGGLAMSASEEQTTPSTSDLRATRRTRRRRDSTAHPRTELLQWTEDTLRDRLHRRVEHAGRRAGPPRRPGASRRRRAVPRHRLPLRGDHRHP